MGNKKMGINGWLGYMLGIFDVLPMLFFGDSYKP